MTQLINLWQSTGLANFTLGQIVMILVGCGLLFLAIKKQFEPLLLLPIGFGAILSNIPVAGLALSSVEAALQYGSADVVAQIQQALGGISVDDAPKHLLMVAESIANKNGFNDGILYLFYAGGVKSGLFPLLIFMGVGALTDFGPLLANPKTLFLGAAAQFGIFATLLGAIVLNGTGLIAFTIQDASAIAIIGGADGPTAIFLANALAPKLLAPIAVAAYSYMALVPIIQPPIMKALTTPEERQIKMAQLRPVTKLERILFPLCLLTLCLLFLPTAAPLIGMFCFGNLLRESGVVDRLSKTAQNELINVVTIFLGLSVGSKLTAEGFLNWQTIGILILGAVAFCIGTASGVLMGKLMCKITKGQINPLIGAAGVSAVPMAARVVNKVGIEANPQNFLLMHAMGPNVAGVIGSAVAAGILLALVG